MLDINKLAEISRKARAEILTMVHAAQSGHPGGSLSVIDILTTLYFTDLMHYDGSKPDLPERDRLILSKGHATPAFYSTLSTAGYFSKDELPNFRKINSLLQGHPQPKIPGVEVATGSLGVGFSVALGIALTVKLDGYKSQVYAVLGDGELQEGQVWETAMSAGYRKLNNLVAIVDHNGLAQDNTIADLKEVEPIKPRFEAFGWYVLEADGHDFQSIYDAVSEAKKYEKGPAIVVAKTVKGKGVSFMENELGWHGKAPNDELLEKALNEVNSHG